MKKSPDVVWARTASPSLASGMAVRSAPIVLPPPPSQVPFQVESHPSNIGTAGKQASSKLLSLVGAPLIRLGGDAGQQLPSKVPFHVESPTTKLASATDKQLSSKVPFPIESPLTNLASADKQLSSKVPFPIESPLTNLASADKQLSSKVHFQIESPLTELAAATDKQPDNLARSEDGKLSANVSLQEGAANLVATSQRYADDFAKARRLVDTNEKSNLVCAAVAAGACVPVKQSLPNGFEKTTSPLKECVRTFIQTFVKNREKLERKCPSVSDGYDTDSNSIDSFQSVRNSMHSPGSLTSFPNRAQSDSNSDSSPERLPTVEKPSPISSSSSGVGSAENKKSVSEGSDSEISTAYSMEDFVADNTESGTSVKENTLVREDRSRLDDITSFICSVNPERAQPQSEKAPPEAILKAQDTLREVKPKQVPEHPVFDSEPKRSREKGLPEDPQLFEDLFEIEDTGRIDDIPTLDLPPVDSLAWDLKDLPSSGDLFAIDTEPSTSDNLFQVPIPRVSSERALSGDFGALKSSGEAECERTSKVLPSAKSKEGLFYTGDKKINNR